jgi:hypothetical protein
MESSHSVYEKREHVRVVKKKYDSYLRFGEGAAAVAFEYDGMLAEWL